MWPRRRLLRVLYGPVEALSVAALLAAAILQFEWLAVVALAVALLNEVGAVHSHPWVAQVLAAVGFRAPVRAMFRSLFIAVMIGVEESADPISLELYGATASCAHGLGFLCYGAIGWTLARAPARGVRNIGDEKDLARALARVRRHRPASRHVLLALEWMVVLGIAVAMSSTDETLVASAATAVGVVLMIGWTLVVLAWSWRLVAGPRFAEYRERLLEDLRAHGPEVIVYMSAAAGQSGYMLNQWLPALSAMQRRAMIVVREESNLEPIGATQLPIVHAPATRDVEQMVLPSVRVAFYVANAGRNVQLLREPGIKHVFLNHGDSDKATSANPVSRVYDEVWVAGQAAIDRYEAAGVRIPSEHFAVIGRPQVDRLAVGPRRRSSRPCLLYAPTWEGIYEEVNYSSLEIAGPAIVAAILSGRPDVDIVFKPHPASGAWRPGMRVARREVERLLMRSARAEHHVIGAAHPDMTLHDCFELADVLVSDISSVVTDFLYTERPIITTNPIGLREAEFRAMFPTQRASYVLGPDFTRVAELVDRALAEDPLADARRETKRYALGDLPDGPMHAFDENVERICEQAGSDAERIRNTFIFSPAEITAQRGTGRSSMRDALRRLTGVRGSAESG
jgi:hypothetical protein